MKKIYLIILMTLLSFVLSFFEFNSIYFIASIPLCFFLISYRNRYFIYGFLGMLLSAFFVNYKSIPFVLILSTFLTFVVFFILNKFKINFKALVVSLSIVYSFFVGIFTYVFNQQIVDFFSVLLAVFLTGFLTFNVVEFQTDLKKKEEFTLTKKQMCFFAFFINLVVSGISLFNSNIKINFIFSSVLNYFFVMLDPLIGFIGIVSNMLLVLAKEGTLLVLVFIPLIFAFKSLNKSAVLKGSIYALVALLISVYLNDYNYVFEVIFISLIISLLPNKIFSYLKKFIVDPHDYELKLYQKSYYKCLNKNKQIYKVINLLENQMKEKENINQKNKEHLYNAMQFLTNKLKDEENIEVKSNIIRQIGYMNVELIGFKIFSDYFYNYCVNLEIKGNKNIIERVVEIISENLGVKLYVDYKYYNKVLGSYFFILKNDEKIKFNISIKQRSKERGVCGDSYLIFNTKNKKYLLISDGMGHGKKASKESSQALLLLKDFVELGMNPKEAIVVCNALLFDKDKESFNTLDLFEYDSYEDKMCVYKNGSGLTYVRGKKKVERISSKNLPLGIIEEINVEKKFLNTDLDYIVLTSDGFKKDLSKVIGEAKRKNSKVLSEEILKYEGNDIEDDQTIVVISVIKKA